MPAGLRERYEVIEQYPSAPLGVLFRALDRESGEKVVVRELRPPPNLPPDAAEQVAESFRARGAKLQAMQTPRLAKLLRVETQPPVVRQVFAAPEGGPLRPVGEAGSGLTIAGAARVCQDVAAAVAALWAQGLPVAGISPSDVFISASGEVTLVDPGIVGAEAARAVWDAGVMPWAFAFLAPEVLQDSEPTEPAVVYSLAAMLYWLVAGRASFEGANPVLVAQARQSAPYEPVSSGDAELDDALNRALSAALSADPARRPGLAAFAGQLAAVAGTPAADILPTLPEARAAAAVPPAPARTPTRGLAWAAIAALVVVVAATLVVQRAKPKSPAGKPPPVSLGTRGEPPVRLSPSAPRMPSVPVAPRRPVAPVPSQTRQMPQPSVTPSRPSQPAPATPQVYGSRVPASEWAVVEVRSTVAGAKVSLDGVYAGIAPKTMQHVSPGIHTLTVEATGHRVWSTQVTAVAGEPALVIANLEPQ